MLLALLTSGEGWHSFHHAFPHDYRNGHKVYHWDPSKWFIYTLSQLGLVWDLFRVEANEVRKAMWVVKKEKIEQEKREMDWGVDYLPVYSLDEISAQRWMVIDGKVLDVSKFRTEHPGGEKLIDFWVGKDATKAFYGVITTHSGNARRLIDMLAVGKLRNA